MDLAEFDNKLLNLVLPMLLVLSGTVGDECRTRVPQFEQKFAANETITLQDVHAVPVRDCNLAVLLIVPLLLLLVVLPETAALLPSKLMFGELDEPTSDCKSKLNAEEVKDVAEVESSKLPLLPVSDTNKGTRSMLLFELLLECCCCCCALS